jgi:hypothetical protein
MERGMVCILAEPSHLDPADQGIKITISLEKSRERRHQPHPPFKNRTIG